MAQHEEEAVAVERVAIDWIRVEGRHRKDLGNLGSLVRSMEDNGLINPITVTPVGVLLAGGRRIAAARVLGWSHIDARVVDTFDDAIRALHIERDENTERKDMTPSELVALGEALEALENPAYREAVRHRQRVAALRREARKRGEAIDNDSSSSDEPELHQSMREVVASALGMAESTYQRMKTVVGAARDPLLAPDARAAAAAAVADLDAGTETINSAYERVKAGQPDRRVRPVSQRINGLIAQRRAIATAEAAISGIAHGLSQITDLDRGITSEEAARWVDGLTKSRRTITTLINLLRERTNGTA